MRPAAVVTGAGRGLGRALCLELADRDWTIVAVVRRAESARALAAEVPDAHCVVADVADDSCVPLLVDVLERLPAVDLLINNAGIVRVGPRLAETCPADVLDSFNVHCLGALRATQATLPWLQRAPRPAIVNISSRRGSLAQEAAGGAPGDASYAYRIAKAAQNMLTVCLSGELRHAGIPVLAVHPGALLTGTAPPDAAVAPRRAARRILALAEQADRAPALFLEPPDRPLPW